MSNNSQRGNARKHYVVIRAILRFMRGGVRVWKRGLNGHGLRHATAYALQGGCDAAQVSAGADVGATYAETDARVTRWSVSTDGLVEDQLDANQLRTWIDGRDPQGGQVRSEEHTSELQSRGHLVCRLLLEKKNEKTTNVNL